MNSTPNPSDSRVDGQEKAESNGREKELIKNRLGEFTERYALQNETVETKYGRELISEARTVDGVDGKFASPKLRKRIEFAQINHEQPIWLGIDANSKRDVGIPRERFFQHTLILGSTGYGKSVLLNNIHLQLILSQTGAAIIDGKGNNTPHLLQRVPKHRLDDVVYLDVGGFKGYASGFNYLDTGLSPTDPAYDTLIRSIMTNLLMLLDVDDQIEDRFENILVELVDAMIRVNINLTLADLYTLLDRMDFSTASDRDQTQERIDETNSSPGDPEFVFGDISNRFIECLIETNTEVVDALNHLSTVPVDQLKRFHEALGSLLHKKQLRRLINQRNSDLKISDAVADGKVIVFRLTGSTEERKLLGTAFLRRLWSVLRSRSEMPKDQRDPFFVSIDEGQNVVRDSLTVSEMLREARGYNVGFLFATQNLAGIDSETTTQLYSNSESILAFGQGGTEKVEEVATQLDVDPQTLINESKFHVWMRIDRPEKGQRTEPIRVYTIPPSPPLRSREAGDEVLEEKIKKYGMPTDDMSAYAAISEISMFD